LIRPTTRPTTCLAPQEENRQEGVELPEPDLSEVDNADVVRLIGGRPKGILVMLNEECVVPKGSDETLLAKLIHTHAATPRFKQALRTKTSDGKNAFVVEHFVGPVTYTVTNMLLKNKDPVSEDFMTLLQHSKAPFVKGLFASSGETKAVAAKTKATKFQASTTHPPPRPPRPRAPRPRRPPLAPPSSASVASSPRASPPSSRSSSSSCSRSSATPSCTSCAASSPT
jgi:hypothetical protein